MYNYPYQISSAFSRNMKKKITTTLGIEAHFSLEDGKTDSPEECSVNPLEIHAGYSRFTVALIKKDEVKSTKSVVTANIPAVDDADRIIARTRACTTLIVNYEMNKSSAPDSEAETDPAYTVTLMTGNLKGKTPAQLLLEDAVKNRKLLIEQYKFLESKLQTYPANQAQLDAIKSAIKKYDACELEAKETTGSERAVTVYEANFKPLKSTLDESGKVLVYSISIKCYPGRNYPYEVTVSNKRCRWDGQVAHPQAGDWHDEVSIYLDETKWLGIVAAMERQLDSFTLTNYIRQYQKADAANRYNRLKAVKKDETNTHSA